MSIFGSGSAFSTTTSTNSNAMKDVEVRFKIDHLRQVPYWP
jgi:hypothetical protein